MKKNSILLVSEGLRSISDLQGEFYHWIYFFSTHFALTLYFNGYCVCFILSGFTVPYTNEAPTSKSKYPKLILGGHFCPQTAALCSLVLHNNWTRFLHQTSPKLAKHRLSSAGWEEVSSTFWEIPSTPDSSRDTMQVLGCSRVPQIVLLTLFSASWIGPLRPCREISAVWMALGTEVTQKQGE